MNRVMKFGILGCGMIANIHADAIGNIEDAELAGVTDPSEANSKAFAEKYGVPIYADYTAMLNDEDIDIVCICTPSGFHADAAIQALKHGKHVVLEKPMALTVKDADAVSEMVRESGCFLTVVSQLRFSKDVKKVKKLVENGVFGKLVFCDLYMKYWREPAYYASSSWKGTFKFDGGGALMNQGIHGVDLLLYIAGNAVVTRGKIKTISHNIEVEDTAIALLEFENGAIGVIEASTCASPGFNRRIEIIGDRGYVILQENKIEELMIDGKDINDDMDDDIRVTDSCRDAAALESDMHELQIRNLIYAIRGEEPLLVDVTEGRKAVKLIRDIYES